MKIIIAPDKFKGSLSSAEVCNCIEKGIKLVDNNIDLYSFPMADGGDGFADVMQRYTKTEMIQCLTVDPLDRPLNSSYLWNDITKTAIIEMATASGLVLLKAAERNPMKTSSYGTGLLIKDAIGKGAKKIILGIGGSATNDAGTGILSALGFVFTDDTDKAISASGEKLLLIQKIIPPAIVPSVQFEIACDVDNVLYGSQGAAYIYAPQKGATQQQVELLDKGLRHFSEITIIQTNKNIAGIKGAGAAGGIAAGMLAFLQAELKQGTQIVIDASNIKKALANTDLIITGEGKIDTQSKDGKLVSNITVMAKQHNIPVIGLCASLQLSEPEIKELGLENAYSFMNESMSLDYAMKNAADLLCNQTISILTSFLEKNK
jgi:glycerate 2-kinase